MEILVLGERLGDQARAHDVAAGVANEAPVGLVVEERLPDGPERERVDQTAESDREDHQHETLRYVTNHGSFSEIDRQAARRSATITTSISLMPTKGTITPPSPQMRRLRRRSASAPSGLYSTPRSAIGI